MNGSWENRFKSGMNNATITLDDIHDEILSVLSASFGVELNSNDINTGDETLDGHYEGLLESLHHHSKVYAQIWLLNRLLEQHKELGIEPDKDSENRALDEMVSDLFCVKNDWLIPPSESQDGIGEKVRISIAGSEDFHSVRARTIEIFKPMQNKILDGLNSGIVFKGKS